MIGQIVLTTANVLGFALFAGLIWFLSGLFLLPVNKKRAKLDTVFLATTIGFATYTVTLFIFRLLKMPFIISYLPFAFLSLKQIRKTKAIKSFKLPKLTNMQKWFVIIAILGMLIQGIVLFRSAIVKTNGIQFTELSFHDSVWHVYLINELKENFPPRHGGSAPVLIKNYHFLLDLITASIGKYLPLSTYELYYRVIPVFVSLLLSLGVFIFTRSFFRSEKTAVVALFLTLFSGNASWFVQFFRGEEFQYSANTFMLDPITDILQNPHAVIVFPLMLAAILCLKEQEKKTDSRWLVLSILPIGVLIGFKAWGGLIMLASLPIAATFRSLTKKKHDFWIIWFLALLISLIIFLPNYDHSSAAGIVFAPGWLLKRMVEDPDRYNWVNFFFLEQHYKATNNILRLILINLTEFAIYLIGNLWVKILGLAVVIKWLLKKISASQVIILMIIGASLLLPVLFNQGRMAYDIIQFGPYSLLLLSILTAPVVIKISIKFPKKTRVLILLILLAISVPSNSKSIVDRIKDKIFIISKEEMDAYKFVRDNTDLESVFLIYPTKRDIDTTQVPAFTQRPAFFSGKTFLIITGENYKEREEQLISFFSTVDLEARNKLIKNHSIDYLIIPTNKLDNLKSEGLNLEQQYSNEAKTIYKIN